MEPLYHNIKYFQNQILKWFKLNARTFPWRAPDSSPYETIISEIMLQRTKAENVKRYFSDFILIFPSWQSLATEETSTIETYLRPLGLYRQRAARLHELANYIMKNQGNLPRDRQSLEKLPFMGQYIANAVELLIFNQKKPLLDVNMARVLERIFGSRILSDIRYDKYLQNLAHQVAQHTASKQINWAILDFAALTCKARNPLCQTCPFQSVCKYYIAIKTVYPLKKD